MAAVWEQAHLRMLATLPVRTHQFDPPDPLPKTGLRKGVVVGDREFPSVMDACRALRCSTKTIYKKLSDGSARYA